MVGESPIQSKKPYGFFSSSRFGEVVDLNELKGDISRPSGQMNPRLP
jgi:hypothetical protein